MICHFKVRWYENGVLDEHYMESGYVAGESYIDCYAKIQDWYFTNEEDNMDSIEISAIPCVGEDNDIVVTESCTPERIVVNYDPNKPLDINAGVHYYDCDED